MTEPATTNTHALYTAPDFVDVDNIRTAYRRKGEGERVLYLHGDGFTAMWLPFFDELSKQTELVVPEHPGYGETPLTEEIQSFDDLVLHYDAFLEALDLEPLHVVGQGIGGWLAADLAVFYPRRFKSLTLITPAGLRLPDAPFTDPFRMTPEERRAALFNGRDDAYEEYLVRDGEPEDTIRAMAESVVAARLMWNPRYDHRLDHRLRRVTAPTLVIGVQDDRFVPTALAQRYAELIPGGRLETVKGRDGEPSGHLPHLEYPAQIAALIADHAAANS
jgi:pimeloyl-ACP methyl ester carboxylesterase